MNMLHLFCLLAIVIVTKAATFERLAGYSPRTRVTDNAALDLDQLAMVQQLQQGRWPKAINMYELGGYSMPIAILTLIQPSEATIIFEGAPVYGPAAEGGGVELSGSATKSTAWGSGEGINRTIQVQYMIGDLQEYYVGCHVGGLFTFHKADLDGCFADQGQIRITDPNNPSDEGTLFEYAYDIRRDNINGRTLQLLSKQANSVMRPCESCNYYDDFQLFYDYYGQSGYGNEWIEAAFGGNSTHFSNGHGNADFSVIESKPALASAIKAGVVALNVFMYVIGKLEDALTACSVGCTSTSCADDAVHALDEAAAYYVGSLEGEDGAGDGVLLYNTADVLCQEFRTCGSDGFSLTGTSYVNLEILQALRQMQVALVGKQCDQARAFKNSIVNMMKIPLVQNILKYAYVRDRETPSDQVQIEVVLTTGATYSAAILPFIQRCNPKHAQDIYDNMRVGATKVDFGRVKRALESSYDCLGITCSEVGGYWGNSTYKNGADPCGGVGAQFSSNPDSSRSGGAKFGIVLAVSLGLVVATMLARRARSRKTISRPRANIAAVAEIC